MANESFNSNVEAVTHDSDPKKLQFVTISQDPARLFQRGETNLNRFGAAVDLANANPLGASIPGPVILGPRLANLTGGSGNLIRVTLDDEPIESDSMQTGQFTVVATLDDESTITLDTTPAPDRFKYDGENSHDWYGPLGYIGPYLNGDGGGYDYGSEVGDWYFDLIFNDETSAAISFTMAQLHALATAQGLIHISYGTLDVTSLLSPILNASGGKTIDHVVLTKNTAFGSANSTYMCKFLIKDSSGALRNLLPGLGPMGFLNLTADPSGTVTPSSTFTLADTPQVILRMYSLASGSGVPIGGLKIPTGRTVTNIAFTRNAAFTFTPSNPLNTCTVRILDSFSTFMGNFATDTAGTQTYAPSDGPAGINRYWFYRFQIPQPEPASIDIPIDATAIISGANPVSLGLQSGTAGRYGIALLAPYAGRTVADVSLVIGPNPTAAQYGPAGLVAPSGLTAYFESSNGDGSPAESIDLRPTVSSYHWPTPPGPNGRTITADSAVKLDFNLFPKDAEGPEIYLPLLTTEPYEIRTRNQVALRFACTPPFTERPGDYTSPQFAVWLFGSQGEVDGKTLWTRIPFNVVGVNGLVQHAIEQHIDAYPFYDWLPDFWAGTAILFDNQEYATPWNYVRFLILPVAENDVSGYVLNITANAREI
jgi:hypothetical protein